MKLKITALVLGILLLTSMALAKSPNAKGPHNKATGDVYWTSAGGLEGLRTVFDAHQGAPGKLSERGTVTMYHPDGGMRVTEVTKVIVQGDEAWFCGEVVEADGAFEGQVGENRGTAGNIFLDQIRFHGN